LPQKYDVLLIELLPFLLICPYHLRLVLRPSPGRWSHWRVSQGFRARCSRSASRHWSGTRQWTICHVGGCCLRRTGCPMEPMPCPVLPLPWATNRRVRSVLRSSASWGRRPRSIAGRPPRPGKKYQVVRRRGLAGARCVAARVALVAVRFLLSSRLSRNACSNSVNTGEAKRRFG